MKNTKTKSIGTRVTPEQREELVRVADRQGRTVSEILRELSEEYIRDWEKSDGK